MPTTKYSVATPFGLVTRKSDSGRIYNYVIVSQNRAGDGFTDWGFRRDLKDAVNEARKVVRYAGGNRQVVVCKLDGSVAWRSQGHIDVVTPAPAPKAKRAAPEARPCEKCGERNTSKASPFCSFCRPYMPHTFKNTDAATIAFVNDNRERMGAAPVATICHLCGLTKEDQIHSAVVNA